MSEEIKKEKLSLTNKGVAIGKIAEFKKNEANVAEDGTHYVNLEFVLQYSQKPEDNMKFKYRIQDKAWDEETQSFSKENKNFETFLKLLEVMEKNTIVQVGWEDAIKIKVNTNFKANDYYSERDDEVVENTIVNATSIVQAGLEERYAHHFNLEGRIVDIQPERIKNKEGKYEESGRLDVTIVTLSFGKNEAIVVKNLKIEQKFVEGFQLLYQVGDTIMVTNGIFKTRVIKIDRKIVASDSMWGTAEEDDEDVYEFKDQSQFVNYERHINNASAPYEENNANYISDELLTKVKAEREIALSTIKEKYLKKKEEDSKKSTSKVSRFDTKVPASTTPTEKKTSKW